MHLCNNLKYACQFPFKYGINTSFHGWECNMALVGSIFTCLRLMKILCPLVQYPASQPYLAYQVKTHFICYRNLQTSTHRKKQNLKKMIRLPGMPYTLYCNYGFTPLFCECSIYDGTVARRLQVPVLCLLQENMNLYNFAKNLWISLFEFVMTTLSE